MMFLADNQMRITAAKLKKAPKYAITRATFNIQVPRYNSGFCLITSSLRPAKTRLITAKTMLGMNVNTAPNDEKRSSSTKTFSANMGINM